MASAPSRLRQWKVSANALTRFMRQAHAEFHKTGAQGQAVYFNATTSTYFVAVEREEGSFLVTAFKGMCPC